MIYKAMMIYNEGYMYSNIIGNTISNYSDMYNYIKEDIKRHNEQNCPFDYILLLVYKHDYSNEEKHNTFERIDYKLFDVRVYDKDLNKFKYDVVDVEDFIKDLQKSTIEVYRQLKKKEELKKQEYINKILNIY